MKPTDPTDQQFEIAILWLENNEGEGEEGVACKAVAEWLEEFLRNRTIRSAARKAGVPIAKLRARLDTRSKEG